MAESPLRVLIVGTSFGFPYGQGAASRVYMYAKALQSAGAEVRVVSLLTPSRNGGAAPARSRAATMASPTNTPAGPA